MSLSTTVDVPLPSRFAWLSAAVRIFVRLAGHQRYVNDFNLVAPQFIDIAHPASKD